MKVLPLLATALLLLSACEKKSSYKAECDTYEVGDFTYDPHGDWYKSEDMNDFTKADAESRFRAFEDAYRIQYAERVEQMVNSGNFPNAYIKCDLSKQ